MSKQFYLFILSTLLFTSVFSQSISIADSAKQVGGSASPYATANDYSYGQTIYLQSEIQGSGNITALTYYYDWSSLSNSDSLLIFIGNTNKQYFDFDELVLTSSMQKVFQGKLSNYTIPGPVKIILDNPFYYNGSGNLVIAVNEKRPGNSFISSTSTDWYQGYQGNIRNKQRAHTLSDLNLMDPYIVETKPSGTYIGASGSGTIANVTLHGLTPLPCQSPRKVRFTNINHNNATVVWSAPRNATSTTKYDLYFSLNQTEPTAATTLSFQNIADTFQLITGLQPTTNYKVWVRSNCGAGLTSIWTLLDSFTTICAPTPIPTPTESFTTWLPNCWRTATGELSTSTQLTYAEYSASQYWSWREWRNVTGSTNFAPTGSFGDNSYRWLISPTYDIGNTGNKSLEFDIALTKNTSSSQGFFDADDKVIAIISTDNGTTWATAKILRQWVYPTFIASAGQHIVIPLNSYSGLVRIAFYVSSQTLGSLSDIKRVFIDNVQISGSLPVTLLEFTGKKTSPQPLSGGEGQYLSANLLQWRTATEQNNRGFELQRSVNGIEFSTVSFVPSKANRGNSTNELSYTYTDRSPFAIHNCYYRLKQIDYDGKFTYSNIVFIQGEGVTQLSIASLYPNPTNERLNLLITSPNSDKQVTLLVADIAGKVVKQQTLQLQKGSNNQVVDVAGLAKGIYLIKLVCANGCEAGVSKFVKE